MRFEIDAFIKPPATESDEEATSTHFEEDKSNDTSDQSQLVLLGSVIDAKIEKSADLDWFRFQGQKDQSLTIACRSHSLDGSVEPVMTLLDPFGNELLHSDARQREPIIHCQLPATGEYRLRVNDRAYRSDDYSFYRVTIHDQPHVQSVFPRVTRAEALTLKAFGYRVDSASTQEWDWPVDLSADAFENNGPLVSTVARQVANVRSPDAMGSVALSLAAGDLVIEEESVNNTHQSAQLIPAKAHVSGRFLARGDIDWYHFTAEKDKSYQISVLGERLGQRMDLDVSIHDTSGKLILALPDLAAPKGAPAEFGLGSLDAEATWKAPADANYLIAVRDLYGGGVFGPDRQYELLLKPANPAFRVFATHALKKPSVGLSIAAGKDATIDVVALRENGYAEPIEVTIENLPEGVTAEPCKLESKETSKTIKITVAENAEPSLHTLRLNAAGADKKAMPVQCVDMVRAGIARCSKGVPLLIFKPASEKKE
ncbi:MAG: hypothetical protein CMJ78_02115 [Planctomycetaceae bacterium]|nr:hypothetical protein [Planctomycetaceae bacterium]